jgi:WD40 repeat protein
LSTSPSRSPVNYSSSRRLTSKNSEQNVFNRLTSETKQSPMPERGIIKIYSGNTNRFRSYPVTLTHVAEGHSKAILSIDSNDFKLYTGSKDRTAKIWDIITGQEIAALNDHNNNVIKIRYCRNTQLCFTATSSYVKVWDLRESSTKCIKNLSPSGLVYDGNTPFSVMNKTKILQNDNQQLDQNINDLAIDEFGNYLYIAAGNSIKIWDLKQ